MAVARAILPVVIGTAGHIDHGKSSLVRALTGIDPDRLKEEKERGLTIDLGFANLVLSSGERIGIVDVPGHERFVRNMVAGATGIDIAMLVVACDDGVMPQTREHIEILDLLGVHRCILVLTKVDLVDADMRELVLDDVQSALRRTHIEVLDVVSVSNVTGEGIEALKGVIARRARAIAARSEAGAFRMPIQRVFTRPGFGTVVSGIPLAGTVAVGDELEIVPGGARGKVRGMQAYGGPIDRARAGHSTAINLTDVTLEDAHRGDVVAPPGILTARTSIDVRVRLLPSAPALPHMTPVRFHVGTKEALGKVSLLDAQELAPGAEGLAQILVREPVAAALGDPFLLRLETPPRTIGGGKVLALTERREKRFRSDVLDRLNALQASAGDDRALVLDALAQAGLRGLSPEEARNATQRPQPVVRDLLTALHQDGAILRLPKGERYLHPQAAAGAAQAMDRAFAQFFQARPMALKLGKSALRDRAGLTPEVLDAVLEQRLRKQELVAFADGSFAPVGRDTSLPPADAADLAALRTAAEAAGQNPPTRVELAAGTGLAPDRIELLLQRALDEGTLVEIGKEFLYGQQAYARARAAVVANCQRHQNELMIPELRDELATSRKYLIPLLEHFDAVGLTRRRGAVRVLAT